MPKVIQNIQNLKQFSEFVDTSKYKVSTFGGRRFYQENESKNEYCMNDLAFTLQVIAKTEGNFKTCKRKLQKLSKDSRIFFDKEIKNKNFIVRLIAKIKRVLGNFFFDRNKVTHLTHQDLEKRVSSM